jgi:hypothetical protein
MFPDNLAKLEFTNIDETDPERLRLHKDGEEEIDENEDEEIDVHGRNEMASEAWQFMTAPTGITAFKSVAIYVGRRDQPYLTKISGTRLSQLQDAADNAAAYGVLFRLIGETKREGTITEESLVNNMPTTRDL